MRGFLALAMLGAGTFAVAQDQPAERHVRMAEFKKRPFTITVGQTVRLQMTSKKPIAKVFNERPTIVRVAPVADDPTTVQVTGLAPGIARITLVDRDGHEEDHEAGPPRR